MQQMKLMRRLNNIIMMHMIRNRKIEVKSMKQLPAINVMKHEH